MNGESEIRMINLTDGKLIKKKKLSQQDFGEGLVRSKDRWEQSSDTLQPVSFFFSTKPQRPSAPYPFGVAGLRFSCHSSLPTLEHPFKEKRKASFVLSIVSSDLLSCI